MDDYLRRLAYDLGLEEEFEAALRKTRAADDFEMRVRVESEEVGQGDEADQADVASVFLVGFGSE
jgi:hypothetical protein